MDTTDSNTSLLNAFDFRAIDEMDPSLADGHKLIYDREVPFELRIQENEGGPQEVGTLEAIKGKVFSVARRNNRKNTRISCSEPHGSGRTFCHGEYIVIWNLPIIGIHSFNVND